MALSAPTLVAGANNFNSVGPPTTLTTAAASVTANVGDLLVALCGGNRSSTVVVTDLLGNTWSDAVNTASGGNRQFSTHYSVVTQPVTLLDTFTGTWSVGSPNRFIYVYVITGATTSSPLDKTAQNNNVNSLNWSSGNTATLAQAAEIVIGGCTMNTNASVTSTSTNSNVELVDVETSDQCAFFAGYKIVAATTGTAVTGTVSGGGTTNQSAATATFKESSGVVTPITFITYRPPWRS